MQLYDKDLLSVQEVRELVEKAKAVRGIKPEQGRGRCHRKIYRLCRCAQCKASGKTGS